jgi:hypothetical protein
MYVMKKPLFPVSEHAAESRPIPDVPFRLSTDLVNNRAQQGPVAVRELWTIGVSRIEVEGCVLRLQEGEQPSAHEKLAVMGRAKMVRGVSTCGDVRQVDDGSKCVLHSC